MSSFVTLSGVDRLFLDRLNLQGLEFLIEHLTQIHDHTLMNYRYRSENSHYVLRTDSLFCHKWARKIWIKLILRVAQDLAMHEYTSQVELYLETNVDVCSIDRQAPPQCEMTIRNLVET